MMHSFTPLTAVIAVALIGLMLPSCGGSRTAAVTPDTPTETNRIEVTLRPFAGFFGTQPGEIELARWQEPESCSECHDQIYEEWRGTMHSNAARDPLYLGTMQHLRDNVAGELERTELRTCTRCHTVAGHLSAGAVDTFANLDPLTNLDNRGGVFCGFCHSVTGGRPDNGGYEVEPGPHSEDMGIMRGPRRDARSEGHQVAYSELHRQASFCGTCHDLEHVASAVPIMTTYTEWREGPYNTGNAEDTVICQDCHMRQREGTPSTGSTERPARPGRSAPSLGELSPEREHIPVHHLVGGNTLIPPVLADDYHARAAAERLQSAATLEISVPERVAPGESIALEARITNSGAGHSIPTGMTGIRQMWLELRVRETTAGAVMLETGFLADDGAIPEGTRTFGTTYGDASGEPVLTFSRAAQVLRDHRIGPRETVTERFDIDAPQGTAATLEISARLLYRPASPAMVNAVMPNRVETIEVTTMAEASATIAVGE